MLRKIAGTKIAAALTIASVIPPISHAQNETLIEPRNDAPVELHVNNGNWLDVRIYAVRAAGIYDRIGTVRSFTSKQFELPEWVTSTNRQLQLIVSPIGSRRRYAAPPVIVQAGDIVEWRLGTNLSNSTISVRAGWNDS
jgi:hypothetical protein